MTNQKKWTQIWSNKKPRRLIPFVSSEILTEPERPKDWCRTEHGKKERISACLGEANREGRAQCQLGLEAWRSSLPDPVGNRYRVCGRARRRPPRHSRSPLSPLRTRCCSSLRERGRSSCDGLKGPWALNCFCFFFSARADTLKTKQQKLEPPYYPIAALTYSISKCKSSGHRLQAAEAVNY